MIKKLSLAFYENKRWVHLLLSGAWFLFFMAVILPFEAQRLAQIAPNVGSPDTSFWYTKDALIEMAREYGEQGRVYYIRSRFTFDIAWPLVYAYFLCISLTYTLSAARVRGRIRYANLLPFAAAFFDLLENSFVSIVFFRYPDIARVFAVIAPVWTACKWVLIGLCFVALIGFGTYAMVNARRKKLPDKLEIKQSG